MSHASAPQSRPSHQPEAQTDLRASFDAAGWMVLRGLLADRDLDPVRAAFAAAVERFGREWHAEGKISDQRLDLPWHERLEAYRREHPPTHSHSWRACIASEGVWRMWQHPALVQVMQSLIGPELWASGTWNGRPRTSGHEQETIGWHQDLHYMGFGTGLYQPGRDRTISCWIPLVAVDETSACLEVCPGSNRAGPRPMLKLPNNGLVGLADHEITPYQPVAVPMQPGDVLLFDEQTFHRSRPNTSGRTRWSLDIRFSDADNLPNIERVGIYINQRKSNGSMNWGASTGYVCASRDPQKLGTFADWKANYDYAAEF